MVSAKVIKFRQTSSAVALRACSAANAYLAEDVLFHRPKTQRVMLISAVALIEKSDSNLAKAIQK